MNRFKWITAILSSALAVATVWTSSISAYAASTIQIGLQDDRPIDIILAAGETSLDLETFEDNMSEALDNAGVDLDRVKIQAVESTNSAAETSFPWQVFSSPAGYTSHASKTSTGSGDSLTFRGHQSDPFTVGYQYDVPSKGLAKFAVEFTARPQVMDSHTISHGGFKFADYDVRISARNNQITVYYPGGSCPIGTASTSGTVIRCEVTKTQAIFYVDGTPVFTHKAAIQEIGVMQAYSVFTSHGCSSISVFTVENVKIETQVAKDLIEVVRDPSWQTNSHRFVVDVTDELREDFQKPGSLGELVQRIVKDGVYYVGMGTSANKSQMEDFMDKVDTPGFFVDNSEHDAFQDVANWIEEIVNKRVGLSGRQYLLKDHEYSVTNLGELPSDTNVQYPFGKWRTMYSQSYTEGSKQLQFIGIEENPFWTNNYQKQFSFSTAQIGFYKLTFEDTDISPSEILVHQQPIPAVSNISQSFAGSSVTVSAVTNSYDPDLFDPTNPSLGSNQDDKGIAEHIVMWREANIGDTTWRTAGATWSNNKIRITGLKVNRDYEIYYNVVDYQGQEGNAVVKYVSTNPASLTIKPISDFTIVLPKSSIFDWNTAVDAGKANQFQTILQDLSYDPLGKKLTTYTWSWYTEDGTDPEVSYTATGGTVSGPNPTAFANFLKWPTSNNNGEGTYYLGLTVSRSGYGSNNTSELYRQVLNITREPYALWFSDMYNKPTEIGLAAGTALPKPEKLMSGYNLNQVAFQNNKRVITYNTMRGNPYTEVTMSYQLADPDVMHIEDRVDVSIKEYPLNLNTEFLWPVTSQEIAQGKTMFSIWGTPTNDWAFINYGSTGTVPKYIKGVSADFVKEVRPWGYDFSNYLLMSTTEEEAFRLTARIPDNFREAGAIYSPQLEREEFDWVSGDTISYDGYYYPQGNQFVINVPSTTKTLEIQGIAATDKLIQEGMPHRVGGVYFRDASMQESDISDNKISFSQTDTTDIYTVTLAEPGDTKMTYFYVMPETALLTGESYQDINTNSGSYDDTVWSTSCYTVQIKRLKNNTNLLVDGQLLDTEEITYQYAVDTSESDLDKFPISLDMQTQDSDAIILGYRFEDEDSWNWVERNQDTLDMDLDIGTVTTVSVMVQAEDRQVQKLYNITIEVTDTTGALNAEVTYTTLDDAGNVQTYTATLDGTVYTLELDGSIKTGKLGIETLNPSTVITEVNGVGYDSNSVSIDYPLPNFRNDPAEFTISSESLGVKGYTIQFIKSESSGIVELANEEKLTDVLFSPIGLYDPSTRSLTDYTDLVPFQFTLEDSSNGYNGNGIPIEITILPDTDASDSLKGVSGISGTISINGFEAPIHWNSYVGPTYISGDDELKGYAIISSEVVSIVPGGDNEISYTLEFFDSPGSNPYDQVSGVLGSVEIDNSIPDLDDSLLGMIGELDSNRDGINDWDGPYLRFNLSGDEQTFVTKLLVEHGTSDLTGFPFKNEMDILFEDTNFDVPMPNITGETVIRITAWDAAGNKREYPVQTVTWDIESKSSAHLEYGRNSDGYYIGTREDEDQSIGLEHFSFIG